MLNTLKKIFRLREFRPLQREIIDSVLCARDNVVLMPPAAVNRFVFNCPPPYARRAGDRVSPLISLMKDQVMTCGANGIAAELVTARFHPPRYVDVMERRGAGS